MASLLRSQRLELASRVSGASMGPTLPPGTAVRILLAEAAGVGPGDVVAFVSGRHIVIHRIVSRGRRGPSRRFWITCGDAEILPDQPVEQGSVLGPVRIAATGGELPAAPRRSRTGRVVVAIVRWLLEVHVIAAHAAIVAGARLQILFGRRAPRSSAEPPAAT